MVSMPIHDQMRIEDFMAGDVAVTAGQWNEIGKYTVGITEKVELGWSVGNMESAIGRIYGVLKNGATVLDGRVKFAIADQSGTVIASRVVELTTDMLNQSPSDMTKRLPFNETRVVATREREIIMYFKPDASGTVIKADSDLIMSITRYSL